MPIKITEFIKKVLLAADAEERKLYEMLLAEMQKKMHKPGHTMRILICNSPNFGHQANTIHVMRHFLRIFKPNAGSGEIEVVYDNDNDQYGSMREKLQILVPGFNKEVKVQNVDVEGISVQFVPHKFRKISDMDYGLTGGFDYDEVILNEICKTEMFWKLQPYKWHRPSAFYEEDTFSFDKMVGNRAGGKFSKMVYRYDNADITLSDNFFEWYIKSCPDKNIKEKSNLSKCLLVPKDPEKLLWPIYGVHTLKDVIIPVVLLKFVLSGLLTARSLKKPVLMVLLCDFKEDTAEIIDFLTLFKRKQETGKQVLSQYIEKINNITNTNTKQLLASIP